MKVTLEPEGGDGEGRRPAEGERDGEKSKGDNNAVLQALYDGAPLSSVFHHDLAEGVYLRFECHMYKCWSRFASLIRSSGAV